MGNSFSLKKLIFIRNELFWLKLFDIFYLFLSFTFWVDLTNSASNRSLSLIKISLAVFIGFLFYFFSGQYKNINKFLTSKSLYLIALRNFVLVLFISNFLISIKITKLYLPLY